MVSSLRARVYLTFGLRLRRRGSLTWELASGNTRPAHRLASASSVSLFANSRYYYMHIQGSFEDGGNLHVALLWVVGDPMSSIT